MALSIRSKFRLLVLLGGIFCALLAAVGWWSARLLSGSLHSSVLAASAIRNHLEGDMMHDALRGDVFAALFAKSPDETAAARTDVAEHSARFQEYIRENQALAPKVFEPGVLNALTAVDAPLRAYIASANELVDLALNDREKAEARMPEFYASFSALEEQMENVSDKLETAAASIGALGQARERTASWAMGLTTLFTIPLLLWVATRISNSVVRPIERVMSELSEGSETLTQVAEQAAAAAGTLAQGASTQAESLEQSSNSLEELATKTASNASDSQQANEMVSAAREAASASDQTVGKLNESMSAIGESAGRINKIIKVIEEIAFQTNLLALNAAVEAARAGEHGRSFAVVADEVRNLARRAAAAAGETTTLIADAVQRAQEGSNVAVQVASALSDIAAHVTNASTLVGNIASASAEQSRGVAQINTAVVELDRLTQQNAAAAEVFSASSTQVTEQSRRLQDALGGLRTIVSG
ncbi:MAG: hypothetical protein JNG88_01005 [Phycisphaerales bacterium]|nr:hypothetical protein [Phycisphaerales bacterium]